jgi:hypothetical protein
MRGLANLKSVVLMKCFKLELEVTHLPKLSLIQYFCSFGDLAAMWFGITINGALTHISSILKYLLLIIHRILFRNVNIFNGSYNQVIRRRIQLLERIMKKIQLIFLSVLMLCKVSIILIDYSKYETITRLEVKHKKLLPLIRTRIVPKPIN